MKTVYLFLLMLVGFLGKAQQAELFSNTWYISKIVINGAEFPFVPSQYSPPDSLPGPTNFYSDHFTTYGSCNSLYCNVTYISENEFSSTKVSMTLVDCYPPDFELNYFVSFFGNTNIGDGVYRNFTYSILETSTGKVLTLTNENGDKAIYGTEKLAVNDVSAQKIGLYPNPVKDQLTIKTNDKIEKVEIYSQTGQLVKTADSKEINTSTLPKGNYILKIKTDKSTVTEKLIKN